MEFNTCAARAEETAARTGGMSPLEVLKAFAPKGTTLYIVAKPWNDTVRYCLYVVRGGLLTGIDQLLTHDALAALQMRHMGFSGVTCGPAGLEFLDGNNRRHVDLWIKHGLGRALWGNSDAFHSQTL